MSADCQTLLGGQELGPSQGNSGDISTGAPMPSQDSVSSGPANRADPLVIYAANRDALASRLSRETKIRPESIEYFLKAWESEAGQRGLDRLTRAWWEPAWEWIVNHGWVASRNSSAG